MACITFCFLLVLAGILTPAVNGQGDAPPSLPPLEACDGIFIEYQSFSNWKIPPFVENKTDQAYAFVAGMNITNTGVHTLRSWKVFIGFDHREVLVEAWGAVLPDGDDLPADASNGTFLSGYPVMDLKTAIETAGDPNQYQVRVILKGSEFGVAMPDYPMPNNLSLANDGYTCPPATIDSKKGYMYVCCSFDGINRYNRNDATEFSPRRQGDLIIDYDVTQSYGSSYLAQVTINNSNPMGRLDNWKLSWTWTRGEFIYMMKGAYTLLRDASDCINGAQGVQFPGVDFATVMNCQRNPTIVDLPSNRYNDTNIGRIEFCCRNGTILPYVMDPLQSKSQFIMQVYKMPPDLNKTKLFPPQDWKIRGNDLNPEYECSDPIRVNRTMFPDPSGLQFYTPALASWQIVCNVTTKVRKSHCCVSFSAYYNDSVVPCNTCACGCPGNVANCNSTAPALLLPSEALLVPFDNRTAKELAWAQLKHFTVPNLLPCGDFCGVSINWHVYSDYRNGWSARITLFNWEDVDLADWFAAIGMNEAFPGYENAYSFNGTALTDPKNTIFMHGLPGLNYLMAIDKHGDPPVPGKVQSIISFNKKATPGINMAVAGFPSRVFFNGEECSVPSTFPTADAHTASHTISMLSSLLISAMAFMLVDQLR